MIKVQVQLTLFLQGFFFTYSAYSAHSFGFCFFLTCIPGEPLGTISSLTRINVSKYILMEQTILREAALLESVWALRRLTQLLALLTGHHRLVSQEVKDTSESM